MKEKLKNFAWGYIILFAILTGIGILCISFHNTLPYVALGVGAIITLYGIIYGVLAIASKERGPKFAFKVTIAVCSIIAGVITMVFCKKAVDILTALMGLFLIIDGSFKLQSAAISKRYKSVGWWFLLVPALIAIIGGFLITRYESDGKDGSVSLISVSLGIILIIDAISNFLTAFLSGKLVSASPDNAKKEDSPMLPEAKDANADTNAAIPVSADSGDTDDNDISTDTASDADSAPSDNPKYCIDKVNSQDDSLPLPTDATADTGISDDDNSTNTDIKGGSD